MKTQRHYINSYRKIIPQHVEHLQSVVPAQAYSANADETSLEYSLNLYTAAYQWAVSTQCVDYDFFNCLMQETKEMHKKVSRYRQKLNTLNYDIIAIVQDQKIMHEKYKKV